MGESVTQKMIEDELVRLGIVRGDVLEVHSSLKSFGHVEGGAETVISALKNCVGNDGTVFMPSLTLSPGLPLTEEDRKLGITVKIRILDGDAPRTAMGKISDTFRCMADTETGSGVFRISGWGKHAHEAVTGGLDFAISNGGKAVLFGVDIYKLTAMHYVEGVTPREITEVFAPSKEILEIYPEDQWFVETGHPPVKAWYTIQKMAFERNLIRTGKVGECSVMCFSIKDVVSIYEDELKRDPFGLWGMKK